MDQQALSGGWNGVMALPQDGISYCRYFHCSMKEKACMDGVYDKGSMYYPLQKEPLFTSRVPTSIASQP